MVLVLFVATLIGASTTAEAKRNWKLWIVEEKFEGGTKYHYWQTADVHGGLHCIHLNSGDLATSDRLHNKGTVFIQMHNTNPKVKLTLGPSKRCIQ